VFPPGDLGLDNAAAPFGVVLDSSMDAYISLLLRRDAVDPGDTAPDLLIGQNSIDVTGPFFTLKTTFALFGSRRSSERILPLSVPIAHDTPSESNEKQ
jgi:hypothetical protein